MTDKLTSKESVQKVPYLEEEIHRLKKAERDLQLSERKYRTLYGSSRDAIMLLTPEEGFFAGNPSAIKLFGCTDEEEFISKSPADLSPEYQHDRILSSTKADQMMAIALEKGSHFFEWKHKRTDGTEFYATVLLTAMKLSDKKVLQATVRDISMQKRAEESLRKSEAQKQAILDASIAKIRHVDQTMRIIWANKTTAELHGLSPEDLVGQFCYKAFVGRDTPCEGCPNVKARETGRLERAFVRQTDLIGIKGESYWDVYCVPLRDEAGKIEGFIQVARNVTDQKRAEERIHALSQDLLKAQENERHRISRYLHDHVAQDLSSLKIGLETLLDKWQGAPHALKDKVSRLSESLQDTIATIRSLAYDLRPASLDQFGLVPSIFQYCEDFAEKTGVNVDFHSAGLDDLKLEFDVEINLYRLILEALNNVKKHAEADHVVVRIVASFPNILIRIEDNGKGFDVEGALLKALDEKRMGLGSMQERVSLLNGKLKIRSHLMEGTKIFIEIPYKEKK